MCLLHIYSPPVVYTASMVSIVSVRECIIWRDPDQQFDYDQYARNCGQDDLQLGVTQPSIVQFTKCYAHSGQWNGFHSFPKGDVRYARPLKPGNIRISPS